MRPIRLELEGFASFREPTHVDFADADLFVLAGPTGAGKSSVIDALTFALYGTVPRYGDRRVVAPVISQGRNEARVKFDFTVAGSTYTAVRVVRRTKTGATTKEARLERHTGTGTATIAGTADELTTAVERLLGLSFEHFTTCIVLPQGAFQEFLHARPKDRQDLLVELLDLDVYRKVGQAARDRATAAAQDAQLLQRRLDGDLALATPEAQEEAERRADDLDGLLHELDDAQPRLDAIREEGTRLRERHQEAARRAKSLADLVPPDGVDAVSERVAAARASLEQADGALDSAGTAVDEATDARDRAGDPTPLRQQLDRIAERDALQERRDQLEGAVRRAETEARRAHDADEAAADAVEQARDRLDHARRDDLVATVSAGLHAGDPCPVCGRPLDGEPTHTVSGAVDAAAADLERAEAQTHTARQARNASDQDLTRLRTERDGLAERLGDVTRRIEDAAGDGVPTSREALTARLAELDRLDAALVTARQREQEARRARRGAANRLQQVEDDLAAGWRTFDAEWQRLAELQPPAIDRNDLAGTWHTLVRWADDRRPELEQRARDAESAVEDAAQRWRDAVAALRERLRAHDVAVRDDEAPRDVAVRELERARSRAKQIRDQVVEAAQVRRQIADAERRRRLAHALGQHLNAKKFERWLMNRALHRLVVGATQILHDLSGGDYSLDLDDQGSFLVIDHRNADEARSARTLSGGETFLASLSLALALSDHVADLAAQGAARLDSLILDEGFGTLDADTLDVVATTLEELGSRGRMVGVITHVPTLADRLPVRFDVRKVGGTSTIRRVPAGEVAE